MKFFHPILFFAALLATSCAKNDRQTIASSSSIRIIPEIRSRVTVSDFEQSDAIGVTVRKQDGTRYLENQCFTYDGSSFSATDVEWYSESEETSTVTAYYPYAESGQPDTFTVKTDQRGDGYTLSDLLGAVRTDVKPALSPIDMTFYHLLAKIDIELQVSDNITVENILIGGFVPTTHIDLETLTASLSTEAAAQEITAREVTANAAFEIILPPQTTTMLVSVESSAGLTFKEIPNVTLLQGRKYALQMNITQAGAIENIRFTGVVEDWANGITIEQDPYDNSSVVIEEPEDPDNGEAGAGVDYGGIHYPSRIIGGKEWMTANLYYKPEGVSYRFGYWYPYDQESRIAELGILYSYQTAMAGAEPVLNDAATIRGICPEGWRLPMINELAEVARAAGRAFFVESGYYYLSPDLNNRHSTTRNYVLSSTHPDAEHVQYLRIPNGSQASDEYIQTWTLPSANIASSVRCVKQ